MTTVKAACAAAPDTLVRAFPPLRRAVEDDLLSAGLGLEGLRAEAVPEAASLRRRAVHKDFRELVDVSDRSGFTRLYGPRAQELRVPGVEVMGLLRLPGRLHPFAVQVLLPDGFDWQRPCLVVAPSSGSRGATGAIGDIGTWALTRGCGLVLTDKGTGVGAHLLGTGEVYGADLAPVPEDTGAPVLFRAQGSPALEAFRAAHPHAIALKHAHGRENAERDWGLCVLEAARFGLHTLFVHGSPPGGAQPAQLDRVRIIAAGISNGGGAVLRAGEADQAGLIDGVVAAEPNVTPRRLHGARVLAEGAPVPRAGLPLYDVATAMTLLGPAAVLAPELAGLPFADMTVARGDLCAAWARDLAHAGWIAGDTEEARARDALARLRGLGFTAASDPVLHLMVVSQIWPAVAVTFANAYGRFGVEDQVAGVQAAFKGADGAPAAPSVQDKARFGALSNGLAPSAGAHLFYDDGTTEPTLTSALALRRLYDGPDAERERVHAGMLDVLATADPGHTPVILLHGRGDSLINPSHTSRSYLAAAISQGTDRQALRYYEIEHGQHFDAFLMLPDLGDHYVPLKPYIDRSLDLMRTHLEAGEPLPPSQVVRTRPAPAGADGTPRALTPESFGVLRRDPGPDGITWDGRILIVPA